MNWYDSKTLEPLKPMFISSVDNGNLACCLWTLKQGALAAIHRPIFHPRLFVCIGDLLDLATEAMKIEGYSNEQVAVIESVRTESRRMKRRSSGGARRPRQCLPRLRPLAMRRAIRKR